MSKEQITIVLEDLKRQLKEASDRFILLTGAVQGAEAALAAFDEVAAPESTEEPNGENPTNKPRNRQRSKK